MTHRLQQTDIDFTHVVLPLHPPPFIHCVTFFVLTDLKILKKLTINVITFHNFQIKLINYQVKKWMNDYVFIYQLTHFHTDQWVSYRKMLPELSVWELCGSASWCLLVLVPSALDSDHTSGHSRRAPTPRQSEPLSFPACTYKHIVSNYTCCAHRKYEINQGIARDGN